MELLKERIRKDGKVGAGNILKVDSFINHQLDVEFLCEIGKEFHRRFADENITKILTIEASGIAIASLTAQYFHCPVVFAKKNRTLNIAGDVYTSQVASFTHKNVYTVTVSKDFLQPEDRILIIDDFLAQGNALMGLQDIVNKAGATVIGAGIVIEKGFQDGGNQLRAQGMRIESLARILSMSPETGIVFA